MIGIFYILFFYLIGNLISNYTGHHIPGSVIGMILMFFSLFFKLIDPEKVKTTAKFLTANMGLFFIPAGAGIMTEFKMIQENWLVIIVSSVISTILILSVVAGIQQKMEKK